MHTVADESTQWVPVTDEEKEMVREQMRRLLGTSHFKNSRRYQALFRFIVEETLGGRGDLLKERLLGVRVFDRPPDYDTASDPIVRVTIAEIRKRIAQYYHEEAHESEMRIELLPGHYTPEFRPRRLPARQSDLPAVAAPAPHVPDPDVLSEVPTQDILAPLDERKSRRALPWSLLVISALAVTMGIYCWRWYAPTAVDEFWSPIIKTRGPITFCLPNGAGKNPGMASVVPDTTATNGVIEAGQNPRLPTFLDHESLGENVVFSDALAAVRISNLMAVKNRESRFRLNVSTTLDDLRQGPAVLIGGMDNQWTLHAIAPLRFHFGGDDSQETFWIADTKNPQNKDWILALKTHYAKVTRDYAIIARIHDETTGEPEVIVAGIGMSGTAAAGEFLVDPVQLAQLRQRIGPGFRNQDFEVVLAMDVVDGIAGSPKILTVAVW